MDASVDVAGCVGAVVASISAAAAGVDVAASVDVDGCVVVTTVVAALLLLLVEADVAAVVVGRGL